MNDFPGCTCVTADIGCAYLNARMPKHDPEKLVFIKIDPDMASLLVEVRKDELIIAELNKALYGCIESAVLWYEELS